MPRPAHRLLALQLSQGLAQSIGSPDSTLSRGMESHRPWISTSPDQRDITPPANAGKPSTN